MHELLVSTKNWFCLNLEVLELDHHTTSWQEVRQHAQSATATHNVQTATHTVCHGAAPPPPEPMAPLQQ